MSCREIELPKLMLAADLKSTLAVLTKILDCEDSVVRVNARALEFAEPLPMCLLAAQLHNLNRLGGVAEIFDLKPEVAERLRKMDVLDEWLKTHSAGRSRTSRMDTLQARIVTSQSDADSVANFLAERIADFTPAELDPSTDTLRCDRIEIPLAYMFSELLDNAVTHARGRGFLHANAWIAAQYYPQGGRIRVAVVDNGCGFLRSLESHPKVLPRTHEVAIRAAFEPRVSCNREVLLFDDSLNQGIGLTISRDIALRSGGLVQAGSGDRWISNPGRSEESVDRITYWQGSMLNFELHRAGLISFNFRTLFAQYQRERASCGPRFV
jgi:hypothetical protein